MPIYLPPYIERCLRVYGNTVLSERLIKQHGEDAILKELKRRGLPCVIRECVHTRPEMEYPVTKVNHIVEVIR